jgi:hypothetical protein
MDQESGAVPEDLSVTNSQSQIPADGPAPPHYAKAPERRSARAPRTSSAPKSDQIARHGLKGN